MVGSEELGPWEPLTVADVVRLFNHAEFRWWLGGGHALEAHLDRSWRSHDDVDIGITRSDAPLLFDVLTGWDIHLANDGELTAWDGRPLEGAIAIVGNLWCRPAKDGPWVLDVLVGHGTDDEWIYKRDPSVRRQWTETVLRTGDGVPYLAPEVQMLFKSANVRPKDELDAAQVIPGLNAERAAWLGRHLGGDHPWQGLIRTA